MEVIFIRSLQVLTFVTAFFLFTAQNQAASSARTRNFIVSAPTKALADEIAATAERYRRELAVSWLGKELPAWRDPCPIRAKVDPHMGAGGATSFLFETQQRQYGRPTGDGLFHAKPQGRAFGWEMSLQGSRERILDSVLPHEITHTIFATHFGRPLPRWADEGACTTVEHVSEKRKQDRMLHEFLTTERGIPFNRMFAMTEYPDDILPLYSQGYSLARYLIQQGGRRKFVQYVGDGLNSNDWSGTTKKHYGHKSISDLQVTWLSWVRSGSQQPRKQPSRTTPEQIASAQSLGPRPPSTRRDNVQPGNDPLALSRNGTGSQSWYLQQQQRTPQSSQRDRLRDLAMGKLGPRKFPANARQPVSPNSSRQNQEMSRPVTASRQREVLMEWGQPSPFLNPRLAPPAERRVAARNSDWSPR